MDIHQLVQYLAGVRVETKSTFTSAIRRDSRAYEPSDL